MTERNSIVNKIPTIGKILRKYLITLFPRRRGARFLYAGGVLKEERTVSTGFL